MVPNTAPTIDRIPDPFLGFNEIECQWVNETAWSYRTTLPDVETLEPKVSAVLAFDGLDTYATVKLNDEIILKGDNMFIPYRVDVTKKLRLGQQNVLQIDFDSAFKRATAIKDAHPEHSWVGFNGDMARLASRKAQYHW
jgi:beta-mannosidase